MIETKYVTSDGKEWLDKNLAEAHQKKISAPARTLSFYGSSDDLQIIEGTRGSEPDEFSSGHIEIQSDSKVGMRVFYNYYGCWGIGIGQLDEDIPLPEWPMRWSADGYSTLLEIDVPAGTVVKRVNNG